MTAAAASTGPLLRIERLTVTSRGLPIVADASLTVERGEIVGLVGESGSGKSTLCRSVAALLSESLRIAGGHVWFQGQDISQLKSSAVHRLRPRGISMVFQDPLAALSPVMRLGDQIGEALRARQSVSRTVARSRAVDLLERMGIDQPARRARDYPHQVSGGQRQRAVLAMAIASDPLLLLADEPTSAVDVTTQSQILALVRELATERGMGVLLVSHDYAVIAQACSTTAVMYGGRIVERGDTTTVLTRPAHPYTRLLIGALPSIRERRPHLTVIPTDVRPPGPVGSCPFYSRCDMAEAGTCTTDYVHRLDPVAGAHATACVRQPTLSDADR